MKCRKGCASSTNSPKEVRCRSACRNPRALLKRIDRSRFKRQAPCRVNGHRWRETWMLERMAEHERFVPDAIGAADSPSDSAPTVPSPRVACGDQGSSPGGGDPSDI